jgi:alkylation response protein AidB-like acyl-CoA dehydrogenase
MLDHLRAQFQAVNIDRVQEDAQDQVWDVLTAVGFPGFLIPAEYGGTEKGLTSAALVMEELGECRLDIQLRRGKRTQATPLVLINSPLMSRRPDGGGLLRR